MLRQFVERGGYWVLGQTLLMTAVGVSGPLWCAADRGPGSKSIGIIFLVCGAACAIAGARALGRNLTPFPQPRSNTRLVQHGIYALIRHPLYTAVTCAGLGWALLWGSQPAVLLSLVLALYFDAKARREERALRDRFPDYAGYERRVRRFVPWIY